MAKQIPGFGTQISNVALAIFKKDQSMFKNNMTYLIYAAANEVKEI